MKRPLLSLCTVASLAAACGSVPSDQTSVASESPTPAQTELTELPFAINDFQVIAKETGVEIFDTRTGEYVNLGEFAQRANAYGSPPETVGLPPMAEEPNSPFATAEQGLTWGQSFGAFYVFFRGGGADTDTHPLRPCVAQDVTHVHLTIKKTKETSDYAAWAKFHAGTYVQSQNKCYVLFDSQHPWMCLKACPPTRQQIESGLKTALAAALAAAGISVSAAVLANAAAVMSYAVFVPLAL